MKEKAAARITDQNNRTHEGRGHLLKNDAHNSGRGEPLETYRTQGGRDPSTKSANSYSTRGRAPHEGRKNMKIQELQRTVEIETPWAIMFKGGTLVSWHELLDSVGMSFSKTRELMDYDVEYITAAGGKICAFVDHDDPRGK